MKLAIWTVFFIEIAGILFGLYNEVAPSTWPLTYLPNGMGLSLALVGAAMALVLKVLEKENDDRAENKEVALPTDLAKRLSLCAAVHERDFYALWPEQVKRAQDTVDVTHLALQPPRLSRRRAEGEYFSELREIYRTSAAHIRRVERLSMDKEEWITTLVEEFDGLHNVSLAVYRDPLSSDMPAALSVCRIDDQYAWLIAIAEHESTGKHRDVLLTGKDTVDLIRRYFQDRLWARSVVLVDRGVVRQNWKDELQI